MVHVSISRSLLRESFLDLGLCLWTEQIFEDHFKCDERLGGGSEKNFTTSFEGFG